MTLWHCPNYRSARPRFNGVASFGRSVGQPRLLLRLSSSRSFNTAASQLDLEADLICPILLAEIAPGLYKRNRRPSPSRQGEARGRTNRSGQQTDSIPELRNQLVHNVRNVGFTLAAHIKKLSISERRAFVRSLFYLRVWYDASEKEIDKGVRLVRFGPKYALWFIGMHAPAGLYLRLSSIENHARSANSTRNARK
jgi:hypothetical protein